MGPQLLRYFQETYRYIKARRRLWIQGFDGLWYQEYSPDAHKIFLARFDESVQKLIAPARAGSVERVVESLKDAQR